MGLIEELQKSSYTIKTFAEEAGLTTYRLMLYAKGIRKPRKKTQERIDEIMKQSTGHNQIIFHPSYGYATQQQIEKLRELKSGADFDYIMKQIEAQTKNRGKK